MHLYGFMRPRNVLFVSVTSLLLVTALIRLPCPVCDGTGMVNSMPGTENVTIEKMEYIEEKVFIDSCGVYKLYRYTVKLQLLNDNDNSISGWIKMSLLDTSKEADRQTVDTQYAKMDLNPRTVTEATYDVFFGTGLDEVNKASVAAEVVRGDVEDLTCEGSGRLPLNVWFFVNVLKNNFYEITRQENPYKPPVFIDWSDYYFDNEE